MKKEDGEKLDIIPFHVFNIISGKNIFDCKVISDYSEPLPNTEKYIGSIVQNIAKTYLFVNPTWLLIK